ncbi:MAG: hypothetical protein MRJ68_21185 [Nitrospira sp.]|nr:hypothetical protein [Nitrospira sp.]
MVEGPRFSLIVDLFRSRHIRIPTQLVETIHELGIFEYDQLAKHYGSQAASLTAFVGFLEHNDYGFWTREPERFPPIDDRWDPKGHLSNVVIDLAEDTQSATLSLVFSILDELLCRAALLRVRGSVDARCLRRIQEATVQSYTSHIEVECEDVVLDGEFVVALDMNPRLRSIRHNRRVGLSMNDQRIQQRATYTISETGMIYNAEFFLESGSYNTFLNRKAYIDIDGNFSNIPNGENFGNLYRMDSATLKTVTQNAAFRKYWSIATSKISKCRSCEYRRSCYNPQVPITDGLGEWHYAELCDYDPHTGVWRSSTAEQSREIFNPVDRTNQR